MHLDRIDKHNQDSCHIQVQIYDLYIQIYHSFQLCRVLSSMLVSAEAIGRIGLVGSIRKPEDSKMTKIFIQNVTNLKYKKEELNQINQVK